jgi:hypothetical protein
MQQEIREFRYADHLTRQVECVDNMQILQFPRASTDQRQRFGAFDGPQLLPPPRPQLLRLVLPGKSTRQGAPRVARATYFGEFLTLLAARMVNQLVAADHRIQQ